MNGRKILIVDREASETGEGTELEVFKARVRFPIFFLAAAAQTIVMLAAFWLAAPKVFRAELSHPWLVLLWTFLFGLPLSLFEYLYHRYLLHSAVLPFVSSMQRAHGAHHGLTNVKAAVRASAPQQGATVRSEYSIVERHQEESMMFPLYSGLIFVGVFEILFGLPFKLMFPSQPILVSVLFAVMLYYSAYEVWHALLHLPFETFWEPQMNRRVVRRVYGFHLMHHWRPTSNQAIVGFWGVAVWDHLFHTHRRPANMPLHEAQVTYVDGKLRKPRWPISMFDRWQGSLARGSRRFENFLGRVFLGRRQDGK